MSLFLPNSYSHSATPPVFEEILQVLEQQGQLERFRSVADTLLIAIDGSEYFSSS